MGSINLINILTHVLLFLELSQHLMAEPQSIKKCPVQDSVCLTKQTQAKIKTFLEGDAKRGIGNLNNLRMDPLRLQKENMIFDIFNIEVHGLNNTIMDEVSIDMALKILRLSWHTTIELYCDYKAEGYFFTLPIAGDGKAEIKMKNMQMEIIILFDIAKNEQGKDIMDLKANYYGYDAVDGVNYYFGNMYNGDKAKSEQFHKLINKTWRTTVANFGRFFTNKLNEKIVEALKIYTRSRPLEEFAIY